MIEGTDDERLRIIQKKLDKGMNSAEIADLMELPVDEIKKLVTRLIQAEK